MSIGRLKKAEGMNSVYFDNGETKRTFDSFFAMDATNRAERRNQATQGKVYNA
jgi:hypothetical protein